MENIAYHVKRCFYLLQGKIFIIMSCSYHVDMFHTHSQSFKRCCTSVATFIANCIFCVNLVGVVARLLHWGRYVVHMFQVFLVMSLSDLSVRSCSKYLFSHLHLVDPTLSPTGKTPWPIHSAWSSLAWTTHGLFLALKQHPCPQTLWNAQYLPSRTAHYVITVLKLNLWCPKLCNLSLLPKQNYKFCSIKAQS